MGNGLQQKVILLPQASKLYKSNLGYPFQPGSTLEVHAAGSEIGGFSLSTTGVKDLKLESSMLVLRKGHKAIVSWVPEDSTSRVQVLLQTGSHNPHPPALVLLCDVADSEGQIEIPSTVADAFVEKSYINQKFSHVIRYHAQERSLEDLQVEFFVGSAALLIISISKD